MSLSSIQYIHDWTPGWNTSNCKGTGRGNKFDGLMEITHGFHVYKTRPRALDSCYNERHIVIPVRCFGRHYIASGHHFAAFRRCFLDARDLKRVLSKPEAWTNSSLWRGLEVAEIVNAIKSGQIITHQFTKATKKNCLTMQ